MAVRPLLDELIVEQATNYIKAHANGDKPFYTYVSLSHVHMPEEAHPDFNQTDPSRLGPYADLMAEQDYRVGQIVDCVDQAGISDNTLIVFSSDNGGLESAGVPTSGAAAPPAGSGGLLHPAIGGQLSDRRDGPLARQGPGRRGERRDLHRHDWYKTFAALAGASDKVPTDRPIDGIDASPFLLGKSQSPVATRSCSSGRHGELMSAKCKNIKVVHMYCEGMEQPIVMPSFPLHLRPRERSVREIQPDQLQVGRRFHVPLAPSRRRRVGEDRRRVPAHQAWLRVQGIPTALSTSWTRARRLLRRMNCTTRSGERRSRRNDGCPCRE